MARYQKLSLSPESRPAQLGTRVLDLLAGAHSVEVIREPRSALVWFEDRDDLSLHEDVVSAQAPSAGEGADTAGEAHAGRPAEASGEAAARAAAQPSTPEAPEVTAGSAGRVRLTTALLCELGAPEAKAGRFLPELEQQCPTHAIDTPLRMAHFLAQTFHESSRLRRTVESLNYTSAERILAVFGNRVARGEAEGFVRQPQRLANRVYANRIGNGPESSGDGWRFRGRGLIQLTGRANYRAFSDWLGEDVTAAPDRVADELAVHAAVFFWESNRINALADSDDLPAVTRRVNGGLNGLPDRLEILEKAKLALGARNEVAFEAMRPTHRVSATGLNLRSAPRVTPSTLIATLDQGTLVAILGDAQKRGWVRIRAFAGGALLEGVVDGRFLAPLDVDAGAPSPAPASGPAPVPAPAPTPAPAGSVASLPEVHLPQTRARVDRRRDGGRAHRLNESGMPRRQGSSPGARARELLAIAAWLDSEKAAHGRYQPQGRTTFCNIYAYDFCCLAAVYLPRVWWKSSAVARIAAGERVEPVYGTTVEELNVNRLHDWLGEIGPGVGWERLSDLDTVQAAANLGHVCLITAQHQDPNRSGHVAVALPEHDGVQAARDRSQQVLRPVQSQAGSSNHRVFVPPRPWWRGTQFRAFAFWRCD